eukprot:11228202-Lingulodinium_polyedra.AAC.1
MRGHIIQRLHHLQQARHFAALAGEPNALQRRRANRSRPETIQRGPRPPGRQTAGGCQNTAGERSATTPA